MKEEGDLVQPLKAEECGDDVAGVWGGISIASSQELAGVLRKVLSFD